VQTLSEAQNFVQDLKLGHYVKVAPRATFMGAYFRLVAILFVSYSHEVQSVATIMVAFVQVGVKQWLFANVKDMCSPTQPSHLICPHNQVFFTASAIW
jgi:hypothetical protein